MSGMDEAKYVVETALKRAIDRADGISEQIERLENSLDAARRLAEVEEKRVAELRSAYELLGDTPDVGSEGEARA